MKHTPGPWEFYYQVNEEDRAGFFIVPKIEKSAIALCYINKDISKEEAEANATYICKAVNLHETLVETLRGLLKDIEHYGSVNMLPSSTAINHAKEVLQKATGGQP